MWSRPRPWRDNPAARDRRPLMALELKVLGAADVKLIGMGAYLGVSQGSALHAEVPSHLTYRPLTGPAAGCWLIGKGVTFDSGG